MMPERKQVLRQHYIEAKRFIFSLRFVYTIIILGIAFLVFWYMAWTSALSRRTLLINSLPELTIYLASAGVVGFCFALWAFRKRPQSNPLKLLKFIGERFIFGAFIGFFVPLNSFDVYVYLFPAKKVTYIAEYRLSFPGPQYGKSKRQRCEAGIWVKDPYTSRWIHLCSSKGEVHFGGARQRGMDDLKVTARVNALGTYIESYSFTWKPLAEISNQ